MREKRKGQEKKKMEEEEEDYERGKNDLDEKHIDSGQLSFYHPVAKLFWTMIH